ncbi:Gag-Pol polyprotein [Vitis vinifera]|uniref:Gag-Pol polyprotein n=1 Tax=Vitis vinifera TaxID=29760 RepID=A0A438H9U0_VITVI|nr:Gag-Pol polyprotein [Vitis vinifera]
MGPFPMSFGNSYILVGVDYVSKWVEAIPCKHNDHRVVLKFLKENIFSRFGVPKAIISDGGTHFCNKPFETLLAKYGVKHKVATPYHPQLPGNLQDYSWHVSLSLVYGKACHLPVEVEYKAWWAIKRLNMDLIRAGAKRLHIFPGKLKSRWIGPFIIHQVHLNGVVELLNSNGTDIFKVNGHRLKPFIEPFKQKMRKSTSLSHKKPDQRRVRWTCYEVTLWHTVPFRSLVHPFRSCEMVAKPPRLEILISQPRLLSQGVSYQRSQARAPSRLPHSPSKSCTSPVVFSTQPCELEELSLVPIDSPENPKRHACPRFHLRAVATTSRPISG